MTQADPRGSRRLAYGLIALGVLGRLLPHIPNVTPATALALFGTAMLPGAWGLVIPLLMVALRDCVIGLYDTVLWTWAGFTLTASLGWWIRRRPSAPRIIGASCLGSMIFFLVTNFGVWLIGDRGTMYPKTLDGLRACYWAALPFLRASMLGDLVYTVGVFGLYALASRSRLVAATARPR